MLDRPLPISTVSAKLASATPEELLAALSDKAARRVSASPAEHEIIHAAFAGVYRGTLALAGDADPEDLEADAEALSDMGVAIDNVLVRIAENYSLPNPGNCARCVDVIRDEIAAKLAVYADEVRDNDPRSPTARAQYNREHRNDVARDEGAR